MMRILFLVVFMFSLLGVAAVAAGGSVTATSDDFSGDFHHLHRKLLPRASAMKKTNRLWEDKCTTSDILISQVIKEPLPNGIPAYRVEIVNMCRTGCNISSIHLNCGWFSSVGLINPRVFKRLGYNDCLVNARKPLPSGQELAFQYANTYPYPLSVSSVSC